MGVGLANQLMAPAGQATSGVDWSQAANVFQALLFSPLMGFVASALLLLLMKVADPHAGALSGAQDATQPPPWWIRGLLILTCTGVSFAHGGNDGQKGMGLIMLILIGAAPTAYALNRTMPDCRAPAFISRGAGGQAVFAAHAGGQPPAVTVGQARADGRRRLARQEAQPARRSSPACRRCPATSPAR